MFFTSFRLTLGPSQFAVHSTGTTLGARGSVMVKELCYKPEGRGFDTR
jgi:hypothetical protein